MDCLTAQPLYGFRERDIHSVHPRGEATLWAETSYKGPSMDCFWGDARLHNGESKLVVIGHRGCGKNLRLASGEMSPSRPSIMENTIASFNAAAVHGADFVEFDVQVTKDGCPILFHDELIVASVKPNPFARGDYVVKSIPDVTLEEFLSIGYQRNSYKSNKELYRKTGDGSILAWTVSIEDSFCTLEDAFEHVFPSVGFNIEMKYDNWEPVDDAVLMRTIDTTLQVVNRCARGRTIFFSSFHPDAVRILRRKQSSYPVFFVTDGGVTLYDDPRRNSIEAAVKICREVGLQGIVCNVKAMLGNVKAVKQMHSAGLCVLTYGDLNNLPGALRKQEEAGVDGVIADNVSELVVESRSGKRFAGRFVGVPDQSNLASPDNVMVGGLKPVAASLLSAVFQQAVRT